MRAQTYVAAEVGIFFAVSLIAIWATGWLLDVIAYVTWASTCPACYMTQAGESWSIASAVGVITFMSLVYSQVRVRQVRP